MLMLYLDDTENEGDLNVLSWINKGWMNDLLLWDRPIKDSFEVTRKWKQYYVSWIYCISGGGANAWQKLPFSKGFKWLQLRMAFFLIDLLFAATYVASNITFTTKGNTVTHGNVLQTFPFRLLFRWHGQHTKDRTHSGTIPPQALCRNEYVQLCLPVPT